MHWKYVEVEVDSLQKYSLYWFFSSLHAERMDMGCFYNLVLSEVCGGDVWKGSPPSIAAGNICLWVIWLEGCVAVFDLWPGKGLSGTRAIPSPLRGERGSPLCHFKVCQGKVWLRLMRSGTHRWPWPRQSCGSCDLACSERSRNTFPGRCLSERSRWWRCCWPPAGGG